MFLKKSTSQVDRQVSFQRGLHTCPLDEILNQKRKTCSERGTGAAERPAHGLDQAAGPRARVLSSPGCRCRAQRQSPALQPQAGGPLLIALSPPPQSHPSLVPHLRQDPCSRLPGQLPHAPASSLPGPQACAPLRSETVSRSSQPVQNLTWDGAALQPPEEGHHLRDLCPLGRPA